MNLLQTINEETFVISDLHFNHKNILQYETVRLEYLADYDDDVTEECHQLLDLFNEIPSNERKNNEEIIKLSKLLIPYHNTMLIEKWNNTVSENNTVFCLGDFAFGDIEKLTKQLNGRKILLMGNHDEKQKSHYLAHGWDYVIDNVKLNLNNSVYDLEENNGAAGFFTTINNTRLLFSHHPVFNDTGYEPKFGSTKTLEDVYLGCNADFNIHGHTHSRNSTFKNSINASVERCTSLSPIRIGRLLENNM